MTVDSFQLWLTQFRTAPEPTFDELVRGRIGLGAWSRASLGEILSATKHEAPAELDDGVSVWLSHRIQQPVPAGIDAEVWPIYLQDVFRAIAGQGLPKTEKFLRDRLYDLQEWLGPLCHNEAIDPQAAYLNALALAETNQHLECCWRKLVMGCESRPTYYREIGLLGLQRMRDGCSQPTKAPPAFLAAIIDLADAHSSIASPALTKSEWTRLTRAMLAGYRLSDQDWATAFEPVLATRPKAKNGRQWLTNLFPQAQ